VRRDAVPGNPQRVGAQLRSCVGFGADARAHEHGFGDRLGDHGAVVLADPGLLQGEGDPVVVQPVSRQPFSRQPSAVQPSAVSRQPSAVSRQPPPASNPQALVHHAMHFRHETPRLLKLHRAKS